MMISLPPLVPMERRPDQVLRISHGGRMDPSDQVGEMSYLPENLSRLRELGSHLVEIDIHETRDRHLVVHHGRKVSVAGKKVAISDINISDAVHLDAINQLQLFEAVLTNIADSGLGLYADVKSLSKESVISLTSTIRVASMADRTILASKVPSSVKAFAQQAPDIPRAILFSSHETNPIGLAREARADFVHPCWESEPRPDGLLTSELLISLRTKNVGVICWHEERPAVLRSLIELGVDGICSDKPHLLTKLAKNARMAFERS